MLRLATVGFILALTTPIAQRAPLPADAVRAHLIGNWSLVTYEIFDENGGARPGRYDLGRVAYESGGEMTAHLMRKDEPKDNYLGYFGPFTIDAGKGTVTHHVIGSSNPSWIGSEQVRYYGVTDDRDRLTLSLKAGGRVTQTLTWRRVK